MTDTYFLGANSMEGFTSLYDGFANDEGVMLHIIKGGPGGGKSGFMRGIGRAAEQRGFDVQYLICSGDPHSLDGVYIPTLRQAWVDGTAPHIIEPAVFAVTGDYVNLGRFCHTPLRDTDRQELMRLNAEYKKLYSEAYACLAEAGAAHKDAATPDCAKKDARTQERLNEILARYVKTDGRRGRISKRFISAHSCLGKVVLKDEVKKLCKLIFSVDGNASESLLSLAGEAARRGPEVILCCSPLCPEEAEAVLLPEYSIGFAVSTLGLDADRHIGAAQPQPDSAQTREAQALQRAYKCLSEAKALHDALEAVYNPYIDFTALDSYREKVTEALFA